MTAAGESSSVKGRQLLYGVRLTSKTELESLVEKCEQSACICAIVSLEHELEKRDHGRLPRLWLLSSARDAAYFSKNISSDASAWD